MDVVTTKPRRNMNVLATSMELFLQPYQTYATTMVRPCHVGVDGNTLLTGAVGGYHAHVRS